jgi:hypothetical protein
MKLKLLLSLLMLIACNLFAESIIKLQDLGNNKYEINIDHEIHINYGCKYPIT